MKFLIKIRVYDECMYAITFIFLRNNKINCQNWVKRRVNVFDLLFIIKNSQYNIIMNDFCCLGWNVGMNMTDIHDLKYFREKENCLIFFPEFFESQMWFSNRLSNFEWICTLFHLASIGVWQSSKIVFCDCKWNHYSKKIEKILWSLKYLHRYKKIFFEWITKIKGLINPL